MRYLTRDLGYQTHAYSRNEAFANHPGAIRDDAVETLRARRQALALVRRAPVQSPSAPRKAKTERKIWYTGRTAKHMIEGACSTAAVDSHRTMINPMGMQCADLPIPLRWKHDPNAQIGEIVRLEKTEFTVWCQAIVDACQIHVWRAIETKELQSFSVAFDRLEPPQFDAAGIEIISSWRLKEISVVPEGGNSQALFWIIPRPRNVVYLNQ